MLFLLTVLIGVFAAVKYAHAQDSGLFDAMATCKSDNWGLPKQSKRTFNGNYDKVLRIPCQEHWTKTQKPFSLAHQMATAIHYKDTVSYDTFQAVDWIPENQHLYSSGSSWGKAKNTDFKSKQPGSFKSAECNLRNDDGSQWAITRIGPIVTTGGYDWLQIGWDDIWGLRDALKIHPDGVYIVEQVISPVWANGTMINHPPIHIHHMHVGPAPYVRQRFDQLGCATKGKGCFNPARTLENHGDYNCVDADGGLECRVETFPEGFAKLITKELGFEGELNDVRPAGSEPLEWYFMMGARWVPKNAHTSADLSRQQPPSSPTTTPATTTTTPTSDTNGNTNSNAASASPLLRAMSLENIAGPGTYSLFHQKEYLLTFPTPTRYESIFWYSGRMQSQGDLLRMKVHAHNTVFDQALFFAASPEDLGLTPQNGFTLSKPFLPTQTTSIRDFRHNQDAKRFFLDNLAQAQSVFDLQEAHGRSAAQRESDVHFEVDRNTGETKHNALRSGTANSDASAPKTTTCGYPNAACVRARPELICQVHGAVEVVPDSPATSGAGSSNVIYTGVSVDPAHPLRTTTAAAPSISKSSAQEMSLAQSQNKPWYADFAYDRRAPTCCMPWQWQSGQVFTVVGFNRYKGHPLLGHGVQEEVPETLAGHVGFWMSYDTMTAPESYHWGYSLYNHYANGSLASVLDMSGVQKVAIAFNGGTAENWNDPAKEPYFVLVYAVYTLLSHLSVLGALILLPLLWCAARLLSVWLCPRGPLRPFKVRDAMCGCGGLCEDCLTQLCRSGGGGSYEGHGHARLVPTHARPVQPYLSSSMHIGGGSRAGGGNGKAVELGRLHGRVQTDDALSAEETESFLA